VAWDLLSPVSDCQNTFLKTLFHDALSKPSVSCCVGAPSLRPYFAFFIQLPGVQPRADYRDWNAKTTTYQKKIFATEYEGHILYSERFVRKNERSKRKSPEDNDTKRKGAPIMKEKNVFFNPIRMISPKLDLEASRIEELHRAPVSESFTLEEGLVVMLSKLIQMTRLLKRGFAVDCPDELQACQTLAEEIHEQEKLLTTNLVCSADSSPELCKTFILFPSRLERVGDFLESILRCCRLKCSEHHEYSDKTYTELNEIFDLVIDLLSNFRDAVIVPNRIILQYVIELEGRLEAMCHDRQLDHFDRLLNGSVIPRSSSPYLDILDSAESLGRHIRDMAIRVLAHVSGSRGTA
jgi:hypothetical protein